MRTVRFSYAFAGLVGLVGCATEGDGDVIDPPTSETTQSLSTSKIAFASYRAGNEEIYSCNADGTGVTRLTNAPGSDTQPAWSPDGTHIAFISDRVGGSPEVYVMNADGTNVVRRTFNGGWAQNPTWSPDGTTLAYSAVSNGSANIWKVGAFSGSASLAIEKPGWDDQPSWSPDGTKIALASDWQAYDFVQDIYTATPSGANWTMVVGGNIFDHIDYLYPAYSPNGAKLAVTISNSQSWDDYVTSIGVANASGGALTTIATGAAAWTKTSWSPDGTKLAYTANGDTIKWVAADGSSSGTIITNAYSPSWR